MKKTFIEPTMDIIILAAEDIIITSSPDSHTNANGDIELPFVPSN